MGKKYEKKIVPVNVHQSMTLAEENLIDRLTTISMDTSQFISPASVIIQWGHEQSSHDGVEMEVIHGFSNTNFHSPRTAYLNPLLSAQYANSRDQC